MSRRGWIRGLIVLVLSLSFAGAADAMSRFGRGEPGRVFEKHAERLGLDEEAMAEIQEIVDDSRARGEELQFELQRERKVLGQMLQREEPDEDEIMGQAERIGELETEARKHRLSSMLSIRKLLTPKQREEMKKIREEKRGEHFAPIQEACGEELEEHCAGLEPGWALGRCMRRNAENFSESCRQVLRENRARRLGKRH